MEGSLVKGARLVKIDRLQAGIWQAQAFYAFQTADERPGHCVITRKVRARGLATITPRPMRS